MLLDHFWKLPKGAKNLIIYYSITSILIATDIFTPIYLFNLGWNIISIGILLSFGSIITIFGNILIGYLFDRGFQPKYAMIIIDSCSILYYLLFAIATDPMYIFVATAIFNFISPLFVAYQTIERAVYPQEDLEKTFSLHMMLPNASQIIGVLLLGFFLSYIVPGVLGFKIIFLATAIFYVGVVLFIILEIPKTETAKIQKLSISKIPKRLIPIASAELIIVFAYSIAPEFILLDYVYNIISLDIFQISLILVMANIAGIIGSLPGEKIKVSRKTIAISIIGGAVAYIMIYFVYYITNILYLVIALGVLVFMSYAFDTLWFIMHRSYFYKLVPEEMKGIIFGTMSSLRNILFLVTPLLSSIIATKMASNFNFVIAGLILMSAIPLYFAVIPKERKE